MKQTAVEWLWDMLLKGEFINDPKELFEQAKEMEKEQIIDAVEDAQSTDFYVKYYDAEQYYNETFNK